MGKRSNKRRLQEALWSAANRASQRAARAERAASENTRWDYAKVQRYVLSKQVATPRWLTAEQRAEMKDWRRVGSVIGKQVDHIVPLRGETVCGLHVPWNLDFLSPRENAKKGNRLAC